VSQKTNSTQYKKTHIDNLVKLT